VNLFVEALNSTPFEIKTETGDSQQAQSFAVQGCSFARRKLASECLWQLPLRQTSNWILNFSHIHHTKDLAPSDYHMFSPPKQPSVEEDFVSGSELNDALH